MTVYRTYNTYTLLTTVLVLVLSALACSLPVPTTPASTVVKSVTTPSKSVVKPLTTPKAPDNTLTTVQVTASQSLHVRTAPYVPARGMYGTVIGYVYHDAAVTLTNKCSYGWAQISWEDGTGWVNAKYLSESQCLTK